MRRDDPERELEQLHSAAERIANNLLELEVDPTRELLEASKLDGKTAARWTDASAALTELWRQRSLLDSLLQRADKLRGGRRREELHELLQGPSVELSSDEIPLADRHLLDGPERSLRCSPRELLERMSRSFDEVKTALAQIGAQWDQLLPALDTARRLAADSRRLADGLGESGRGDLEAALSELERVSAAVSSDPLSARAEEIERVVGSVRAIQTELEQIAALKRDFGAQLSQARELLESLRRVVSECETAYEEAIVKIAGPGARRPPQVGDEIARALTSCDQLAGHGAWRDARRELDRFTSRARAQLDDVRAVLAANRAPLEARNQFRALLDAYQVKAARLGVVEDPQLASIYDQARQELYTAPTDLAAAEALVRRYQTALSGPREATL